MPQSVRHFIKVCTAYQFICRERNTFTSDPSIYTGTCELILSIFMEHFIGLYLVIVFSSIGQVLARRCTGCAFVDRLCSTFASVFWLMWFGSLFSELCKFRPLSSLFDTLFACRFNCCRYEKLYRHFKLNSRPCTTRDMQQCKQLFACFNTVSEKITFLL